VVFSGAVFGVAAVRLWGRLSITILARRYVPQSGQKWLCLNCSREYFFLHFRQT